MRSHLIRYLIVLVLGMEFGSFANVCIYRWPLNHSILKPPRSYCPWCRHQINWWENIPVFSYIFLKGKCAHCQSPISLRYPLVEILIPVLWLVSLHTLESLLGEMSLLFLPLLLAFEFVLVVTTITDLDWHIIPDNATFFLIFAGILLSSWNPLLNRTSSIASIFFSLLGGVVGGGLLLGVSLLGKSLFKKEAMGGGDIKLLTGIGVTLGWKGAVLTLLLGSLLGGLVAIFGLLTRRLKRHQYIPFGPFLNIGALIALPVLCIPSLIQIFFPW